MSKQRSQVTTLLMVTTIVAMIVAFLVRLKVQLDIADMVISGGFALLALLGVVTLILMWRVLSSERKARK
jgi:hypothetical protein